MDVVCEAVYVRQSKDKKDSLSIEGQIERCKQECRHPEAITIYQDKGFSGKNTMRPGFQSMLQDVKAGKISKIIVYRLDRLSRSIIDFGQLWLELERNQVEFVSVNEKFDTTTPMGRAMIYIIMVFAQLERETIGERVTDNYYTRIRHGNWPGGPAPFGMINIKKISAAGQMVPSLDYTEEFEVVDEIFHRYALEDISLGQLASDLTRREIPCKKRAGWDNVALSRILHSPVYVKADEKIYLYYQSRGINNFSNKAEDFDGTCAAHVVGKRTGNVRKYTSFEKQVLSLTNFPGRISSDIWLACQYKLEKNKQAGNRGKGKHTWLTGLLKCGECGYSLSIRVWQDKKHLYCSGRGNLHICSRKSFPAGPEEIECEVQKELEKILDDCNKQEIEIQTDAVENRIQEQVNTIELQIQGLLQRLSKASEVTTEYLNQEVGRLDAQKQQLLRSGTGGKNMAKVIRQNIIFKELGFEEKKVTAQAFIERILVYDGEIEIIWKI